MTDMPLAAVDSASYTHTYKQNKLRKNIGNAVVICNIHFTRGQKPRESAKNDQDRLCKHLTAVGFTVEQHEDKTTIQMETILKKAGEESAEDAECLLCVISSHGTWDMNDKNMREDWVHGTHGPVRLDDLLRAVAPDKAPRLDGKPKIFLLQHCRGNHIPAKFKVTSSGDQVVGAKKQTSGLEYHPFGYVLMMHGNDDQIYKMGYVQPIKRDFFLHFATPPGHITWKMDDLGSPFLQSWCDVLAGHTGDDDIEQLAVNVNAKVRAFETPEDGLTGYKHRQCPQVVSMLTKDFILPPAQFEDDTNSKLYEELGIDEVTQNTSEMKI